MPICPGAFPIQNVLIDDETQDHPYSRLQGSKDGSKDSRKLSTEPVDFQIVRCGAW